MKPGWRRWLLPAAAVLAFWPRIVPLPDRLPDTRIAQAYAVEARQTIAWARDNPVQQFLDLLFVQRWRLSDWRVVPGSGQGSPAIREAADVLVTAKAIGPWGMPLQSYTICCGGSGFTRGEPSQTPSRQDGKFDEVGDVAPPPPPPPPPSAPVKP